MKLILEHQYLTHVYVDTYFDSYLLESHMNRDAIPFEYSSVEAAKRDFEIAVEAALKNKYIDDDEGTHFHFSDVIINLSIFTFEPNQLFRWDILTLEDWWNDNLRIEK